MTLPGDGDLESFEKIVAAHEAEVRAFIAVRIDDPFEAHDLAQEVFLLLWRKLAEIDVDQPLRPWLLAVAKNVARQHRRKNRATPVGGGDAVLEILHEQLNDREPTPGPAFAALEHCVGKLDETARQLIHLRYKDGLGIREIGTLVGNQHSTITMRLFRIRSLQMDCILENLQGEKL